jgi:hypothetical protein
VVRGFYCLLSFGILNCQLVFGGGGGCHVLTLKNLKSMRREGKKFANKPYDSLFGWGDDSIYCSELVWKIYKRALGIELGKLKKLSSFDLTHPVVKAKLEERYGKRIPLDEDVIDPQGVFDSDLLKIVYSN